MESFSQESIDGLKRFISDLMSDERTPDKVEIYFWDQEARISEISCWWNAPHGPPAGGGCSWMRSDVDASAVILAAEDFLLSYGLQIIDFGGDSYYDEAQEAEQKLHYHLTNKAGTNGEFKPWEDRRVKA